MSQPLPIMNFVISIIFDILDAVIGWIPGFGTLFDLIGMVLAIALWGPIGIVAVWEVIDVVDATDSFVPTLTLVGVITVIRGGT